VLENHCDRDSERNGTVTSTWRRTGKETERGKKVELKNPTKNWRRRVSGKGGEDVTGGSGQQFPRPGAVAEKFMSGWGEGVTKGIGLEKDKNVSSLRFPLVSRESEEEKKKQEEKEKENEKESFPSN